MIDSQLMGHLYITKSPGRRGRKSGIGDLMALDDRRLKPL